MHAHGGDAWILAAAPVAWGPPSHLNTRANTSGSMQWRRQLRCRSQSSGAMGWSCTRTAWRAHGGRGSSRARRRGGGRRELRGRAAWARARHAQAVACSSVERARRRRPAPVARAAAKAGGAPARAHLEQFVLPHVRHAPAAVAPFAQVGAQAAAARRQRVQVALHAGPPAVAATAPPAAAGATAAVLAVSRAGVWVPPRVVWPVRDWALMVVRRLSGEAASSSSAVRRWTTRERGALAWRRGTTDGGHQHLMQCGSRPMHRGGGAAQF